MTLHSHPNKPLIKHLEEVANNCKRVISERVLFVGKKDILENIAYIMGSFHDIGKATRYFQHYLLTPNHEIIGPKSHALISSIFVKQVVQVYLSKCELPEFEKQLFAHFAFTAVKRHHGQLENFKDELYIEHKKKELEQQINVFEEIETDEIITYFLEKLNLKYPFKEFKKYVKNGNYISEMPDFYEDEIAYGDFDSVSDATKIEYFYFHQLLFSVLLLSDKRDVILEQQERHIKKPLIPQNVVDVFKEKRGFNRPSNELDKQKNKAYEAALNNLPKVFEKEKHIYSLTLPTGLGKTITSFAVAMKLKETLKLSNQRVIITIPFTSIIDQNFDVYKEILDTDNSNLLLKHHHLAEPIYKIEDDELNSELDANKSQFLIETWQSEVVVTTFVQLLNSIFSNDKSPLMKLPNLANSIVILDEIQTVPYEYWQLIKNTFEVIGKAYNCYFILMSATQPLIFIPQKEIVEIVPNYEQYFGLFNRTKLFNCLQKSISLNNFTDLVSEYLEANPKKDVLIILNTKKHTKKCFEILRGVIDFDKNDIYYLSTMITPYERKKIIALVKKKSEKRKIIVSTQLVEAGVDISVSTVFRAISPIDSIIQAAGRANRYQEKPHQGEVYLYEIEEMKTATNRIYGIVLIQATKNILKSIATLEEKDYLSLIKDYFLEIRKQSENYNSEYLSALTRLNFKDVGKFSLIEDRETESVFLQLNDSAKTIWEEYVKIWENPSFDIFQKKQEFAKIKSQFYDFVINVPLPLREKSIDFDGVPMMGFYLSELGNPSSFYKYDENDFSVNTGYQEQKKYNESF